MKKIQGWSTIAFVWLTFISCFAQESVWTAVKSDRKIGETKFAKKNYAEAAPYLEQAFQKEPTDLTLQLKLARAYYELKNYRKALNNYQAYLKKKTLPNEEQELYANSLATMGAYDKALTIYEQLSDKDPKNQRLQKVIWRLHNINFLFEDSAQVAIRLLPFNTPSSEWAPARVHDTLVFTSNRKTGRWIARTDAESGAPFYHLYAVPVIVNEFDTQSEAGKPVPFAPELQSGWNTGPCEFYRNGMAFLANASSSDEKGNRPLVLHFAEHQGSKWKVIGTFSSKYSIHTFAISEDGTSLIFSAPGEHGGLDLFYSVQQNRHWSSPINLGAKINTDKDECFPFLHTDNTLYFSSNGHPGLGQLDIFKIPFDPDSLNREPENIGYPLNSGYDDFSITLDPNGMHGFVASNRKAGGFDDDLYEFDINLETYPFSVTAFLKQKGQSASQGSEPTPWSAVSVSLVERTSGRTLYRTTTDATGKFTVVVPWFGYYFLELEGEQSVKYRAAFELSKYRKDLGIPEIVVVKGLYD